MNAAALAGRWNIVSWEQRYDDGRIVAPMGKELDGYLMYTEAGYMSVFICARGRKPFASGLQFGGTADEKVAAYDTVLSYGGRYEVQGDTVLHHVEVSLFPNWVGQVQKRRYTLEGDQLAVAATLEAGTPESRQVVLTWKRAPVPAA